MKIITGHTEVLPTMPNCFRCGAPGHRANQCPRTLSEKAEQPRNSYGLVPCIVDRKNSRVLGIFQMSQSAVRGDIKIDPFRGREKDREQPDQTALRKAYEESHLVFQLQGLHSTEEKKQHNGEGKEDALELLDDTGSRNIGANQETWRRWAVPHHDTRQQLSREVNGKVPPAVFWVPVSLDGVFPDSHDPIKLEAFLLELFNHNTSVAMKDKAAFPGKLETLQISIIQITLREGYDAPNGKPTVKAIETVDMMQKRSSQVRIAAQTHSLLQDVPLVELLKMDPPVSLTLKEDPSTMIRSLVPVEVAR